MEQIRTKIDENQKKFEELKRGTKVKDGIFNITASFHPNNPSYFPGVYGMHLYTAQVKENNKKFTRHADKVMDFENNGGMIVLSTDVNAVYGIDSEMKSLITEYQRSFGEGYVSETIETYKNETNGDPVGFTIGSGFSGRYVSEDGHIYDENSITIDISGVDSETLQHIAEDLCHNFTQETVLVKDFNNMQTYLVNGNRAE